MIIPKSDIKTIYTYLLAEGVVVVKKDVRAPKHPELPVSNIYVMNCLRSLKSRGYVTEQFNWQYYYYFLTDEGLLFLRNYLHVPENVVPATMAKAAQGAGRAGMATDVRTERRAGSEEYRRGGSWRNKEQTA